MAHMVDVRIQSDLMSALLAFAEDRNQRVYFNGFAIYCMEIACSFVKEYHENMGKLPPGLEEANLVKNNNLMLYTDRSIGEYRGKSKVHQDFQDFCNGISGNSSNDTLKKELKKVNQELDAVKAANRRLNKFVENIQGPLASMQSNIDEINRKMDIELQLNEPMVNAVKEKQIYFVSLIVDIQNAINEMKTSGTIDDAKFNQFYDLLKARLDTIQRINGVGTEENAVVSLIENLRQRNSELERRIAEIEASGGAAGGGQPAATLSQETKQLLKTCSEYSKLTYKAMPPELIDEILLTKLQSDFQALDSETADMIKEILYFCRDSFCFFHSLEKLKIRKIDEICSAFTNTPYKFKSEKLHSFFENTIRCSKNVVLETQKVFKSTSVLNGEIVYKLSNINKTPSGFSFNTSNIHDIELNISKISRNEEQWKQSLLHAECTYHSMNHQLMFMFNLHILRLVHFLSNASGLDPIIKNVVADSFPILNKMFGFIMNTKIATVSNLVENQEYLNLISDFFTNYPVDQQRKPLYPLHLFHMGAYMKVTSTSYPYCIDSANKKAKFKVCDDSNHDIVNEIELDDKQVYTLLFYEMLNIFKDTSIQANSGNIEISL